MRRLRIRHPLRERDFALFQTIWESRNGGKTWTSFFDPGFEPHYCSR